MADVDTNAISKTKSISFTGKHNIDKINNNVQAIRLNMETLTDVDLVHKKQIDMLNKLYMECVFPLKSLLEKELDKKISGYKAQDIKKELYNSITLITLAETIEKLIAAKLLCHYCKGEVCLLYKNVREPTQWTLDRMNNSKGHSRENTVIACLKCNLQRRVTDIDKFTFTKSLVLKKV